MKVKKWKHIVDSEGKVLNGSGAVGTEPMIRMSRSEGCGLDGCHCSDGYWITISPGRIGNVVEGLTCFFTDQEETHKFLVLQNLSGSISGAS